MLPIMGLIYWPLCLYYWRTPQRLLEMALIGGVFQAASVLSLGGLGLQPPMAPGLTFIGFMLMQFMFGARFQSATPALRLAAPFMAVGAWAVLSSVLLPRLFEGQVMVWPQKLDAVGTQSPLAPSKGNFTQDFYVVLDQLMLVLGTCFLMRREANFLRLYNAYLASGGIIAFFALWQMAHRLAHVPFAEWLLYSNPSWAILDTQMAGPVPRINATFTEPSACATYLIGVLYTTVWMTLRNYGGWGTRAMVVLSALTILITTSTTGYVAMAAGIALLFLYAIIVRSGPLLKRLSLFIIVAVLFFGTSMVAIAAFEPKVISAMSEVVTGTQDKKYSQSYQERTQKDADAMTVFYQTYGLGAGWGSNRASSLMPSFLGTIGAIGVGGLIFADLRILLIAARTIRRARGRQSPESQLIEAAICSMMGRIIATATSGPSVGTIDFYVMLAILIAAIARLKNAQKQEARTRAALT